MEEKIDKLFQLFNDLKNQQLFSLSIQQILSIYNDYPACLYQILKNTNKMIYSKAQDARLRLEHRQLSAAIIEKTYALYCERVQTFLKSDVQDGLPSNLFHFEPVLHHDIEMECEDEGSMVTNDYQQIRENINLTWGNIDFAYLIKDESVILGKDDKYVKMAQNSNNNNNSLTYDQQRKLEEEMFQRMGISQNFNEANLLRLLECMLGQKDDLFLNEEESVNDASEVESEEDVKGNYKRHAKRSKKQTKKQQPKQQPKQSEQPLKMEKFYIINPFNVIYNRAIYELLCPKWEYRHASGLILKSILRSNGFEYLNFRMFIDQNNVDSTNQEMQAQHLTQQLQSRLAHHSSDHKLLFRKAQLILTRCLVVIAMDRFADYITDQTHMLVRELACQISINLLSNGEFKFWASYGSEILDFIQLLRRFVEVSRESQTYEVCQSALFLVKGSIIFLYHTLGIYTSKQVESIPEHFSHLLLLIAEDNIVDEVLTLIAEIWRHFLPTQSDAYFRKVLGLLLKQIDGQDDISFGSKAVFEFLTQLLSGSFKLEHQEYFEMFRLSKKYYFHKILLVRVSYFNFLKILTLQFSAHVKSKLIVHVDQSEKQHFSPLIKQYAIMTFQHSLMESNKQQLNTLATIFTQLCLTLHHLDKQLHTNDFQQVFLATQQLSTIIVNYKQSIKSPQYDLVKTHFTAFHDSNADYKEKNKDLILRLYESIYPQTTNYNHMEFQLLRIIRASSIYHDFFETELTHCFQELELGKWDISILIWLILEVQYGKNILGREIDYNQIINIDCSHVDGEIFVQMDRDIQDNIIILNVILKNYNETEKDKDNKAVIENFNSIHSQFLTLDQASKRKFYPKILGFLKQLGTIDFELKQQDLQKMQDSIVHLVESIVRFNRLSSDLVLNIQSLLICKNWHKILKLNLVVLADILVTRLKVDKFDLIQNLVADVLVKIAVKLQQCQPWLSQLYGQIPGQPSRVYYVVEECRELKRKNYGRKRFMYQGVCHFREHFEKVLFSEMSKIAYLTALKSSSSKTAYKTKVSQLSLDRLNTNVWVVKCLQKSFALMVHEENINDCIFPLIQDTLQQVNNLLQVLNAFQSLTVDIEPYQITMYDHKEQFEIQLSFEGVTKANNPLVKKLFDQCMKIFARLLTCCLVHLNYLIKSDQINDVFNLMLTNIFKLIIELIKQDSEIIYKVLIQSLQDNQSEFSIISPIIVLPTIKKLTQEVVSIQASKLLGQLVPMLAVAHNQSYLLKVIGGDTRVTKTLQKGIEFQQGFAKMTKTEYPILAGLKKSTQLRDYQVEGVRWLGFLVKYNLNAALCDDMGLGKTIQTLTVVANEHFKKKSQQQISLVVAPGTVVDHWYAETQKYIDKSVLRPMIIHGNALVENPEQYNLWLITYNQLVKVAHLLVDREFLFLVLDEAHLLKNSKSKSSRLVRSLRAKHKIILSGTPVQNHLLELWALFDILFPNYLGDEEYFKKHFSKAFHTNLFTLSDDELIFDEVQTQTLRQLHKKVLPFILRRTKQDVLPQLPPKIIQDYICHLVQPLQYQLYQLLDQNSFSQDVEQRLTTTQGDEKNKVCNSVLKLLIWMRKVLDHPVLIKQTMIESKKGKKKLKTDDDFEQRVNSKIQSILGKVEDQCHYSHSGKMVALKDILQQLAFTSVDDEQVQETPLFTNNNKVLIFSRFKNALQLIADQLLKTQFPGLKYLILDGTVPQGQRYPLVTRFNEDPDVKVLLLTTQVGGLGLNLSSANIVIMFDHDYNPVNDQQAIDRAHRIGQKQTVQVYRLIVKDTLEERIMGIQRFKQAISRAIVNADNASLQKMDQTDLLSLLEDAGGAGGGNTKDQTNDETALAGPYQKILSHFQLDQLEQLDFDKEY